jgi:hypothetical protein
MSDRLPYRDINAAAEGDRDEDDDEIDETVSSLYESDSRCNRLRWDNESANH